MKAKDCSLFKDVMQKVFFRMQIFQAQGVAVSTNGGYAQVSGQTGVMYDVCQTMIVRQSEGLHAACRGSVQSSYYALLPPRPDACLNFENDPCAIWLARWR